MKCRLGFVSNSSSASYLVLRDLSSLGIKCVKLTISQISYIRERYKREIESDYSYISKEDFDFVNSHDDIWVTQFISDCSSLFDKIHDENIIKKSERSEYFEGDLGESPRDEDDFNCLFEGNWEDNVWIFKEDDKDHRTMDFEELVDILRSKFENGKTFDVISFGNEMTIKFKDKDDFED